MRKIKMVKRLVAITLTMAMLFSMGTTVFANEGSEELSPEEYVNATLSSAMQDSDWQFTEVLFETNTKSNSISNIVTIPFVGLSTFLNFMNINSNEVQYENSNPDVITIIPEQEWRVLAKGCGSAILTVTCNGISQNIEFIVENIIDESTLNSKIEAKNFQRSVDTERTAIVSKARAMTYVEWMPTGNLVKWGTNQYFDKTRWNYGIPYTQNVQCDENSFISSMSKTDFYSPVKIGTTIAPRYGNDCSGFLSYCWGITRINTVEFKKRIDNKVYTKLAGYSSLKEGDAVWVSGHVFMIFQNWNTPPSGSPYSESYVSSYEQTPSNAQLTFFTYKQLQSKGYIPFSKFL